MHKRCCTQSQNDAQKQRPHQHGSLCGAKARKQLRARAYGEKNVPLETTSCGEKGCGAPESTRVPASGTPPLQKRVMSQSRRTARSKIGACPSFRGQFARESGHVPVRTGRFSWDMTRFASRSSFSTGTWPICKRRFRTEKNVRSVAHIASLAHTRKAGTPKRPRLQAGCGRD